MYAWGKDKGLVMGYFDGNTVTALWNYAQQYAMSDNSYGTTFGPSTPGPDEPGSRQYLSGHRYEESRAKGIVAINNGAGTVVGDLDPDGDVCSAATRTQVHDRGQEYRRPAQCQGRYLGRLHGRV